MSDRTDAPSDLGQAGYALWDDVTAVYELSTTERRLLEAACRTADDLAALEAVVEAEGHTSIGSMGQPVVHPAVQEARQQRVTLARLLGQLALPDEDGNTADTPDQLHARRATRARWTREKGIGDGEAT